MNCKICGTDNPEDAVFCKACGKRLDGTMVCQSCSASIPADSVFCPYCGGKQVVAQQKEQPKVQTAEPVHTVAATEPAVETVAATPVKTENKGFKTFLKYAAPATALITAVLSLIFVFFIGLVATNIFNDGATSLRNRETIDLFYYFGDAYKEIKRGFDALDDAGTAYSDYFANMSYLQPVMGTIIVAFTLIAVCVLSILAIVRSIKCLLGKTQKTVGNLAVAAFLAYIAGALALLALNNVSATNYEYGTEMSNVKVNFNGATLAGISLCSIFAILYLCCTVASNGRELLKANTIVKCALSLVGIGLVIAIIALCSKPAITIDLSDEYPSYIEYKVQYGVTYLLAAMLVACMDWEASEAVLNLNEFTAYAIISFIMLVLTIIFATRALAGFARKMKENNKSHLVVCILFTVFALLWMAFTIVAGKEFLEAREYLEWGTFEGSLDYAFPIASFVLSVAALAISIAQFCLSHKKSAPAVEVVEEQTAGLN